MKISPEQRKRETRFRSRELRVKRNDAGQPTIEGYAAVFNSLSEDLGGFREQILPGAFNTCLQGGPDVRALFNHDESMILGRTKAGTLDLSEDSTGLFWRCVLPPTSVANDLAISIERGDVDQCSFGFYCLEDDWQLMDGTPLRSVKTAEVFDVSAVTYPAYTSTSVSMRSLWKDGQPESISAALRTLRNDDGCDCDCDACKANDCDNCSDPDCDDPNCTCSGLRALRSRMRLVKASL